MICPPPRSTLFPYTTLFRSQQMPSGQRLLKEEVDAQDVAEVVGKWTGIPVSRLLEGEMRKLLEMEARLHERVVRSEEHTSELQSRLHLVCRLLLEKKKTTTQ